ncbi:MAG: T9SS type A sorting domain-containing protein [Saprospiraceae bacterium]
MSTFAAAISVGQILSAANSSGTAQHVIIDGTFEMGSETGYTFASGSDLIFAEDALLLVNSSTSGLTQPNLTILNSTLRGCEDLWEGIKVLQGRGLRVENSTIEDAIHAVTAERNTKIALRGNTFRNNHIGFYVEASPNNQPHTIHHEIRNNVFTSDAALLESVSGFNAYAYAGISVTDMALLDLDGKVNEFEHLQNGILATHSQVRINSQTTFTDIQPETPIFQSYGISVIGEKGRPLASLYLDGNTSDSGDETFLECKTAIYSVFANTSVSNCFFNDCETGVYTHTMSSNKNFSVSNSDFLNVETGIDFFSARLMDKFNGSLFGTIRIEENTFTINSAGFGGDCVRLSSTNLDTEPEKAFFHNSVIRNNKFYLNASGYQGVVLRSCASVKVLQNDFNTNLNDGSETYTCIRLEDYSTNHKIGYNDMRAAGFSGSVEYDEDYDRFGLNVYESPWNNAYCNSAGVLAVGLHYDGLCQGSVIEGNQMYSNVYGLGVGEPSGQSLTILGLQPNRGNTWSSSEEADAEWFSVLIEQNIFDSKFTVHEDDDPTASPYWPDVIDIEGNGNAYAWFVEDTNLSEPTVCTDLEEPGYDPETTEPGEPTGDGGMLTPMDWALINADTLLDDFSDGVIFNLAWALAEKVTRFPDLLTTYAAADTYWDSWTTSSAGELFAVYQGIRSQIPDSVDVQLLMDWMEDAQLVTDSILNLNATIIDSVSAFPAMDSMRLDLYTLQGDIYDQMDSLVSDLLNVLGELETDLNGITPSNDPETRMWKLLEIAIDEASYPGVATIAHADSLELLINECPEIGGVGVIMATGLLKYLTRDATWAHDTCSTPPSARSWTPNYTPVSNAQLDVAPNPGNDWFDIRNADEGQILVTDLYGRQILEANLAQVGNRVYTRNWLPGTYVIKLMTSSEQRTTLWIKN